MARAIAVEVREVAESDEVNEMTSLSDDALQGLVSAIIERNGPTPNPPRMMRHWGWYPFEQVGLDKAWT